MTCIDATDTGATPVFEEGKTYQLAHWHRVMHSNRPDRFVGDDLYFEGVQGGWDANRFETYEISPEALAIMKTKAIENLKRIHRG